VAVFDLHLIVLHGPLVILYRALILQDNFFLIVQELLLDGIAGPRGAVAFHIHLRLCEYVLIALQRALRLQEIRLILARIDVDQRIALADHLPFFKVHGYNQAVNLAGNGVGIDRGYGSDFVKVNADVALGGCDRGDCDFGRCGRGLLRFLVVPPE